MRFRRPHGVFIEQGRETITKNQASPICTTSTIEIGAIAMADARRHRRLDCLLLSVLIGIGSVGLIAPAANAQEGSRSSAQEAQALVVLTNRLRGTVGEANLIVRDDLVGIACEWAEALRKRGDVQHSPFIADATLYSESIGRDWTLAGENVGSGPDVYAIHGALVGSPLHYKNLVDNDFTHVGICVRRDARGNLFVVEEFLSQRSSKSKRSKR